MGVCNSVYDRAEEDTSNRMVVNRSIHPVQLSNITDSTTFATAVLAEHNRLRTRHSAPLLKLNRDISRYAQEWAAVSVS